ncbi:uracil-DNA glycosylase family protein [Sphingomonas sp.]|uniref:uracil-DNA glycosylase family protein n=1 Tax=Sphingomonas sp. TaxID=28214 RepID=UPI0025D33527|nr:uracil-DNA glycosylase family protein [Sphingomonas sp.]
MGGELQVIDRDAADSLINWWLDAGVDVAVGDQPRDWLGRNKPVKAEPAIVANVSEPNPETLAALRDWLANSAQLPLASASARRILPHGPDEAAIMLLSDAPALEDLASGQPIGGDAWALALKMLAAIGIDAEHAYSASLSCIHSPGTRMSEKDRAECAEIARRHISLAKPKKLLLLGDGPCKALLSEPLTRARGRVHRIEGIRTVATFHPRWLLQRPSDKALAWRDLLLLMSESD